MTTALTQTLGNKVSQKAELPALTAAKSFTFAATATLVAQLAITHFGLAPLLGKAGVAFFTTAFTFGGLSIPHLTLAFGLTALVAYAIYKVAAHHNSKNLTSSFAQLAATQQKKQAQAADAASPQKGTQVSKHQVAESIIFTVFQAFADNRTNPFGLHTNYFTAATKEHWENSLKASLRNLYTNSTTLQLRLTQGLQEALKQATAIGMVSGFNFTEHQPMLSHQLLIIDAMIELIAKKDKSSPVLTGKLVQEINLDSAKVTALEQKLSAIVHRSIDAMTQHDLHL